MMDLMRNLHVRIESFARGQTMAEYVLIVAAIAVLCFAGYNTTGTTIKTLVTNIDTQM